MNVLAKFSLRHVLGRPGRALLTLVSIVIGVAAVVSVTIATSTTRRAYTQMFAAVTGRTTIEVTAEGGGTFDESLLQTVESTPGVKAAVPIIQKKIILRPGEGKKIGVDCLGIDPTKDGAIRDYNVVSGRMLHAGEDAVMLDAQFAESQGIAVGKQVKLLVKRKDMETCTVVGLLAPQSSVAARMAGTLLVPLDRLQSWMDSKGQITGIQVVTQETAREADVIASLAGQLPDGILAQRPAMRTQVMDATLKSSEEALRLATGFSLVLAAFIILNTFLMNIGERRRQMAIMRSIGATSSQISRMIYSESLAMGVVGTALGIALGLAGAYGLSRALNEIMKISQPEMKLTALPFVLAIVFGLGVSFLGAALPARRASKLSPIEGLAAVPRGDMEGTSLRFTIVGLVISLTSGGVLTGCIVGWLPVDGAVVSSVFLMIGLVLLVPEVLDGLSMLVVRLIKPLADVESRLAHRQVLRHRTRSTLTVGVLFVASATGIGLANAILDNVQDVRRWYEAALQGDFVIRATMPSMVDGMSAELPPELLGELRTIPGVSDLDTGRAIQAKAADRAITLFAREYTSKTASFFDLRQGDRDTIRQKLFDGEVVIGTVLAQRANLQLGDEIEVNTRIGPTRLKIAGLANDYMFGGMVVFMERETAKRLLQIDGYDAYIITTEPGKSAEVHAKLKALCDSSGMLLMPFDDIKRMIDGMIRGIDGSLWGILVLSFIVAATGVVNTLTMNVLEQTRELGLLRIVAMTRNQVRRTILAQAAILGAIGLVPGTVVGLGVAYLMHLAAQVVLGHPVAFGFRPGLLAASFAVGFAIIIVSAYIPAERAARLVVAKALQYE